MKKGFSLVELSIVLVILGLLTGGILAGQSLIRAAELRSVSTDINRYITSVQSFRDKYMALPGDMTNATAFWGFAGGTNGSDSACINASQTGAGTCNGNGSGKIGQYLVTGEYYERFHFWKQLANAGLIEGTYTGAAGGGGTAPTEQPVIGTNIPRSRISNAGTYAWARPAVASTETNWFAHSYGNMFCIGAAGSNGTCYKVFKPEEAWNIDTKMDDGRPASGMVVTNPNTNTNVTGCADGSALTSNYNLQSAAIECPVIVVTGF